MQKREKITEEVLQRKAQARGWELVGHVDYKNPKTKFIVKCDKGEIFTTNYDIFRVLKGCPCHSKNKKISYDEVKSALEKRGWKLINIIGTKNINCICDKGHKICTSWNNIQKEKQCIVCIKYINNIDRYDQETGKIKKFLQNKKSK